MDKQLIFELINSLIYVVLVVVLPILTTYAVRIMKAKASQIRFESMELMHLDWVTQATDIIADIVLNVQQTFVDSLKNKGEFTLDAAKEAKDKAVELANELIDEEVKSLIENMYTSFDAWLD